MKAHEFWSEWNKKISQVATVVALISLPLSILSVWNGPNGPYLVTLAAGLLVLILILYVASTFKDARPVWVYDDYDSTMRNLTELMQRDSRNQEIFIYASYDRDRDSSDYANTTVALLLSGGPATYRRVQVFRTLQDLEFLVSLVNPTTVTGKLGIRLADKNEAIPVNILTMSPNHVVVGFPSRADGGREEDRGSIHIKSKIVYEMIRPLREKLWRDGTPIIEPGDQSEVVPAARKKLELAEKHRIPKKGLDDQFLTEMKEVLKSRQFNRLYFLDILGNEPWSDPTFFVHLTRQIRSFIQANYNKSLDRTQRWELAYEGEVRTAIEKSEYYAKNTLFSSEPDLLRSRHRIPLEKYETPPEFTIARLLIWDKEELFSPTGQAMVEVHQMARIPLFFLDRESVDIDTYGPIDQFEYHVFSNHHQDYQGAYFRIDQPDSRVQFTSKPGGKTTIKDIGNPVEHFESLLRHPDLALARDQLDLLENT